MTSQEREAAEWPLWVRVVSRLVSGAVVGGVMWSVGHWAGNAGPAIVGGVIGLTLGVVFGERALGALVGTLFECPPGPP